MTQLALGTGLSSSPPAQSGGGGPAPNSPPILPTIVLQFDIIRS